MYQTATERRKQRRNWGWRTLAVAGLLLAVSAAASRYEDTKGWAAETALAGIGVAIAAGLLVGWGSFWPKDTRFGHFNVRQMRPDEVESVRDFVAYHLGPVIFTAERMRALLGVNPDLVWVVEAKPKNSPDPPKIVGCFALYPLRRGAVDHLERGEFEAAIQPGLLCRKNGFPKALYIGAVVGIDRATSAFVILELKAALARICKKHNVSKLFGRPISDDGIRLMKRHKFKTVAGGGGGPPKHNFVCVALWSPH
jgi:hypothetical protein